MPARRREPARQRAASGTAGCRHQRQHRHRLARQEVHRLRDGLVRREFRVAPRGDRESHRTLQGARLRLSRLRVCAVDGARAAARVAGPSSADDLLPRDRWIRGGRPRAAGGDDPYRPPRIAVARRQLSRQLACRVEHRRVRQPRADQEPAAALRQDCTAARREGTAPHRAAAEAARRRRIRHGADQHQSRRPDSRERRHPAGTRPLPPLRHAVHRR